MFNSFHHNLPLFMGLIAIILYSALPRLNNLLLVGFDYLTNVCVYANTSIVTDNTNISRLFDLQNQRTPIVTEMNRLLEQLNTFISRFNTYVQDNDIIVITDPDGYLNIDVLPDLDESLAQQHANRVRVFDTLIHNQLHNIEELAERGHRLEEQIFFIEICITRSYVSHINPILSRLNQLKDAYPH